MATSASFADLDVEQWDTESDPGLSGKGLFHDRPPAVNGEYPQAPVITKTWFHTGAWLVDGSASAGRKMIVPVDLTPAESRDAWRALKGCVLRHEVYANDGSPLESKPYTVSEKSYAVRTVPPAKGLAPGVFLTHPRESIDYHYERHLADPRVQQELTVEVDECGHVRRSVAIGYATPRPS